MGEERGENEEEEEEDDIEERNVTSAQETGDTGDSDDEEEDSKPSLYKDHMYLMKMQSDSQCSINEIEKLKKECLSLQRDIEQLRRNKEKVERRRELLKKVHDIRGVIMYKEYDIGKTVYDQKKDELKIVERRIETHREKIAPLTSMMQVWRKKKLLIDTELTKK